MKIETRFNADNYVYFFYENSIIKRQVHEIRISISQYSTNICYEFIIEKSTGMSDDTTCVRDEDNCFKSIDELSEYYKSKFGESDDKEIVCNDCGGLDGRHEIDCVNNNRPLK